MATFEIVTKDGKKIVAQQLAAFAEYIQGVQFRFVVTQEPKCGPVVTQRASGAKVADITPDLACAGTMEKAGRLALKRLINRVGEARVRSVLAAHE